ncbi:MAG: pantetheine-phosphate adenylyltransferase [Candidatus Thermoplasmatota archaeon]
MHVCIGGTFNPLHEGHKLLIRTACAAAGPTGSVYIGITCGARFSSYKKIPSYRERKKILQQFILEEHISTTICFGRLTDKYGPSITDDFDAIVVSPETKPTAVEINRIRQSRQKKPLQIIEIPFVLAEDAKPISSTRIRNKEIDIHGRLICRD